MLERGQRRCCLLHKSRPFFRRLANERTDDVTTAAWHERESIIDW